MGDEHDLMVETASILRMQCCTLKSQRGMQHIPSEPAVASVPYIGWNATELTKCIPCWSLHAGHISI